MGRGLDGFFLWYPVWRCAVLRDRGGSASRTFPVVMARGKHLFPFRTEQLSPSAPMVLGSKGPGRVGRRRFFSVRRPRPPAGRWRAVRVGGGSVLGTVPAGRELEACRAARDR